MNEPYDLETHQPSTDVCREVDNYVRRNPAAAVLGGLFVGIVIAAVIVGAQPRPTRRQRLARILSDLEDDLLHAVAPIIEKSNAAVGERAQRATREGRAGMKQLEGSCRNWWERITALAS